MKKLLKTLAVMLAFVLAVEAPASASTVVAAGTKSHTSVPAFAAGINDGAGSSEAGTGDRKDPVSGEGTHGGNEGTHGGNEGTHGGEEGTHGGNDGTHEGTDRIPQVVAVVITGDNTDVEVGELIDLEANVITNDPKLAYTVEWSVDGDAVVKESANGSSVTLKAVCGGEATVTATAAAGRKSVSGSIVVKVKEYAEEMHFAQDSYESYLKHKVNMAAELVKNSSTANDAVYYSVSDKKVAAVDAKGVVTMKKTGTAVLTAVSERGLIAKTTITVKEGNPIKKITLQGKPKSIELQDLGATQAVVAVIETKYEGPTTDELTWTSAKTAIVTVEAEDEKTAIVTAVGVGKSKVTVKATSGKSASVTVNAKAVLKDLAVYDKDGEASGDTYPLKKVTLYAERDPEVNTDKIKWELKDNTQKKLAAVSGKKNDTALVTVKAKQVTEPTEVTIKATAGNKTAEYVLTLNPSEITGLGEIQGLATLAVGEEANYAAAIQGTGTPDQITWSSSSAKVLDIDENGHATALKAGKATVKATVTCANGKVVNKSLKVTVTQPTTSLSLKKSVATVIAGKKASVSFTAVKAPKGAAGTISYEIIGDTGKDAGRTAATITKNKVTVPASAVAGDVIVVKASVGDVSTTGVILVLKEKSKVVFGNSRIAKNTLTIEQGQSDALNATVTPAVNAELEDITYSVSKKGIAAVDAEGNVYGLFPGTVKVTAKTTSGAKATVTVKVTAASNGGNSGTGDGNDGSHGGSDKKN